MLGRLGPLEIMIIVGILVFLFGAKKIPELARGLGKGLREFKKGARGLRDEVESAAGELDGPAGAMTADEPSDSAMDKGSQI